MKSKTKIIFLLLFNILITLSLFFFHKISEDFFINSDRILNHINNLQVNESKIKVDLLYINIYLFSDVDTLREFISQQENEIKWLLNNEYLKKYYPGTYKKIEKYSKNFKNYKNLIYEQLKYALPLKNSIIYINNLLPKLTIKNRENNKKVLELYSRIYFSLTSLSNLKINKMKDYQHLLGDSLEDKMFMNHLRLINQYFNKNISKLSTLLNYNLRSEEIKKEFLKENQKILKVFETILIAIVLLVFVTLLFLTFLVYKLDKNYKIMEKIHLMDMLTGLKNRYAYEIDKKGIKKDSILILLDIDNFRHYNDFYGIHFGDEILKNFAKILNKFKDILNLDLKIYRIGGDEFAILGENMNIKDALFISKEIDKKLKRETLTIFNTPIYLSASIGITDQEPYLEKADLALKEAKNDIKHNIVVYKKAFSEKLEINLNRIKEIKEVINKKNFLTYKQAICDADKNIVKYELLTRVKVNNEIKSIFPYLNILKDLKQYHLVTINLLEDAYRFVNSKKQQVSINISVEDLLDKDIILFIEEKFFKRGLGKFLTFELLETEFSNYELLNEFIEKSKKYGAEIAIDDFGSGYSNFERLIKFDIDYIKIDGELIKNILSDKASESLLELLVEFAKKHNIKTIAEFVSNEEIFNKLKEKGILYFQGFYLHKPEFIED